MDNQQAKIEEKDLAWFGGFLDGEGSFFMVRSNRGKFKANGEPVGGFSPSISVANTDFSILPIVIEIARKLELPYWVYDNTNNTRRKKKNKPSWTFKAQGLKRTQRWLKVMIPYLKAKRKQAELIYEYGLSRAEMPRNAPLTERQKEILDIFRNPHSPQRLNALKGTRTVYRTEWYSPTPSEMGGVAQK